MSSLVTESAYLPRPGTGGEQERRGGVPESYSFRAPIFAKALERKEKRVPGLFSFLRVWRSTPRDAHRGWKLPGKGLVSIPYGKGIE
ncbi:hypothetical protein [Croceibacterium aestuarii]|uniref:hypothetical protein n=1 Tax=Croceibacterium aestuarii TaxID=3064139 RepID=UPI00272E6AF3|nr:hypothetical protein [Croceibacterium sp. D39]